MAKINVTKSKSTAVATQSAKEVAPAPTPTPTPAPAATMTGSIVSGSVTTEGGMAIEFKTLTALEQMRLLRAVGRDADNDTWMRWATIGASVRKINGEAVPFPASVREVEFIVQRIDNEGIVAITNAIKDAVKARADASLGADETEQAKNLQ